MPEGIQDGVLNHNPEVFNIELETKNCFYKNAFFSKSGERSQDNALGCSSIYLFFYFFIFFSFTVH